MLDEWGADQEEGVELAGVRGSEWRSEPEWEGGAPSSHGDGCVCVHTGERAVQVAQRILAGLQTSRGDGDCRPLAKYLAGVNGFPPAWCFGNLC